ncbi:MAG TPA: TetR/AcrR family transcriptional regulator [Azospirillaceae bacterium]|nr:TetR/AcrR family transcriptional regulator [Azospirillaceae bacterium]
MPKGEETAVQAPMRAKDRIFEAARDLFYEKGIRAVGVDEVVEKAGVTKPSLYRAFGSKDELVAACLTDNVKLFWSWWEEVCAPHAGDGRAQIRALFGSLAEKLASPSHRGCPLTNAAVEFPEPDHPGRKVTEEHKARLRARFRELARDAGARDADVLGDALMMLMEGAECTSQTLPASDGGRADVAAAAEALVRAFTGR